MRNWLFSPPVKLPPGFAASLGLGPLAAQLIYQRGYQDPGTAAAFLHADRYVPTPADTLPDMVAAAERIERAITSGEKICVWGDFDVDGQTSTTLLVSALRELGGVVSHHIPVRARESHGVNITYLKPILASGVSLIVTCDTGITAHEAAAYLRQNQVDLVVTDHHDLTSDLPDACAAVDPKRLPPGHPLSSLCGVGVAFKLAEYLFQRAGRASEVEQFLDLVALGTTADLATLHGDTRYLLQRGLEVLRSTRRAGLLAMYELAELRPGGITEEHIGFILGPRLNALGRLDDANPIVDFLTATDVEQARPFAVTLEALNARRKLLTDQVFSGALSQIERTPALLDAPVLVLDHPEWPAGVIGIVASQLVERFGRPTILLSAPPDGIAHGSARSVEGCNITAAIAEQAALLAGFGGHPMAAGMALPTENIPAFRRGMASTLRKVFGEQPPVPTLEVHADLPLSALDLPLASDLANLAPFGPGNQPVVLSSRGLFIQSTVTIGRGNEHRQVVVADERGNQQKVIWWQGASWPLPEDRFDLAFSLRANDFRGQSELQLEWIDSRPTAETKPVVFRPEVAWVDLRLAAHPLPQLKNLLAKEQDVLVWREGTAVEAIQGVDRLHLSACQTLVIWTPPPGPQELVTAVEAARPEKIVLFSVDPGVASPEAFLKRLAGLVKHVLQSPGKQTSLEALAAASAQRPAAVRAGLSWLEARGMLSSTLLEDGSLQLTTPGKTDPDQEKEALVRLKAVLSEAASYREHFCRARPDSLL
jgi:single-stranded-DNA-specific exonuclease